MGLFDFAKDILGDVAGSATDSLTESLGGIVDVPAVQEIQEQVTNVTDGISGAKDSAIENGTNIIDDFRQNIGL